MAKLCSKVGNRVERCLLGFIRLLLPQDVAYLSFPEIFYESKRIELEKEGKAREDIDQLLKASYVGELQSIVKNEKLFRIKNRWFFLALSFSLGSLVPYLVCLGFHFEHREENTAKNQWIDPAKNSKFNSEIAAMSKNRKKTGKENPVPDRPFTNLPGIDNSQVPVTMPNIIREDGLKAGEKFSFYSYFIKLP